MGLGPVELIVLAFPENDFKGLILPELAKLVDSNTITIIDGLFVTVDEDGNADFFEFSEVGSNADASALSALINRYEGVISDDDVLQLSANIPPNSSAAILVFEDTWFKPLRDSIVESGGVLVEATRIPGAVLDEVLAAVAEVS
jgi:uncharacterized membrane protein